MKIKPILDKFEIKGIQNISTHENRVLIEHRVPGMGGSLFHDLGTEPTQITIRGSLSYSESRQDVLNLEELQKKFQAALPVTFVADITNATSVKEVLIKDIEIRESEKWPDYFDFLISLKEHVPEPQPSSMQNNVNVQNNASVQNNVNNEAEKRHLNAVRQVTGGTVTIEALVEMEEGERVRVLIFDSSGNLVKTINEHTSDGTFIADNLPTGEYTVSVERNK